MGVDLRKMRRRGRECISRDRNRETRDGSSDGGSDNGRANVTTNGKMD